MLAALSVLEELHKSRADVPGALTALVFCKEQGSEALRDSADDVEPSSTTCAKGSGVKGKLCAVLFWACSGMTSCSVCQNKTVS